MIKRERYGLFKRKKLFVVRFRDTDYAFKNWENAILLESLNFIYLKLKEKDT